MLTIEWIIQYNIFDASKMFTWTVSLRAIFECSWSDMAETSSDSATDFCAEAFVHYVCTGFCFWHLFMFASGRFCVTAYLCLLRLWTQKTLKYLNLSIVYMHLTLLGISKYLVITLSNPLINHERGNLRAHWAHKHIRKLSHGARRALKKTENPI